MMKVDKVIKKNTLFVALWVLILSVFMEAIFLVAGFWNYKVLLGNLYGDLIGIGNFFFLGLTVQKAVLKNESDAKIYISASKRIRMLIIIVLTVVGAVLPMVFNTIALVISLIFPRIAIMIYSLRAKKDINENIGSEDKKENDFINNNEVDADEEVTDTISETENKETETINTENNGTEKSEAEKNEQ